MTKRERFLAMFFGAILVSWIVWEAVTRLYAWQIRVESRERTLVERREAVRILSESRDLWNTRAEWLESEIPRQAADEVPTALLDTIEQAADLSGVTISEKALIDMEPEEDTYRVGARVKYEGEFAAVMNWIYVLQEPTRFVSAPQFTVAADEEQIGAVRGELVLVQWFKPL